MIKTKLILNLGNKSESRQDRKIVGDVEGGLRMSLHTYVPFRGAQRK